MPLRIVTDLWLPWVVAAIVMVTQELVFARRSQTPLVEASRGVLSRGLAAAWATAGGLIALHLMNFGKPAWPPPGLTERLLPAFAIAGASGALAAFVPRPLFSGFVSFFGTLGVLVILLWPMFFSPGAVNSKTAILMVATVALLTTLSVVSIADLDRGGHPLAAAVILTGCGWSGGAGLLGSGNMMLGQFGFALGAAGLGILCVMALLRSARVGIGIGAAGATFALLAGLLLAGNRYGELRPIPALLFSLPAPLAAVAARFMPRSKGPRLAGAIAVGVAALTAGAAAGLAIDLTGHTSGSYGDEAES